MNFPTYEIPFGPFDGIVLLLLALVVPLLSIWDHRRLIRQIDRDPHQARIRHYNYVSIIEWSMAIFLLIVWLLLGRGIGPIGLDPLVEGWQWAAIGGAFLGCILLFVQARSATHDKKELAKVRAKLGDLAAMTPQSDAETRAFNTLSITAGVCEEIIYRGILLAVLGSLIGVWPAVALSSVVFGLAHSYQGRAGILRTGTVGLVLALLTVFSGSIFAAIVVHAVMDITSGRIMRAALRESPTGHIATTPLQ